MTTTTRRPAGAITTRLYALSCERARPVDCCCICAGTFAQHDIVEMYRGQRAHRDCVLDETDA